MYARASPSSFDEKIALAKEHMKDSLALSIRYALEAEPLAEEKSQLGLVYWILGLLHDWSDEPTKAIQYYYGAINAYMQLKEHRNIAMLFENIGTVNLNHAVSTAAFLAYEKGLEYAHHSKDHQLISRIQFELALSCKMRSNHAKTISWLYESLRTVHVYGIENDDFLSRIHNEFGIIHADLVREGRANHLDSSFHHYEKALRLAATNVSRFMPMVNIAELYYLQSRVDTAVHLFHQALLLDSLGSGAIKINTLNNLGKIHFEKGDLAKADSLFRLSIKMNLKGVERYDWSQAIQILNMESLHLSYHYLDSIGSNIKQPVLSQLELLMEKQTSTDVIAREELLDFENNRLMQELKAVERANRMKRNAERAFWGLLIAAALTFIGYRLRRDKRKKRVVLDEIDYIEKKWGS